MPDIKADEIGTQKHHRTFIQYGGPRPGNPAKYAGQDAQYLSLTGVANPESGGIDPVWVHDPYRVGRFRLVARSVSPADLPNATVTFREKHGGISRALLKNCTFNIYEVVGRCKDLSDLMRGWTDYVQIYEAGEVTDKDEGDRTSFDSDDAIENALSVVWSNIYPIGALSFGESAAGEVSREVVDVTYAPGNVCVNDCDWGDQRIYALANTSGAGSPGLPAEVIYSVDGGVSWNQVNIDGCGASEVVYAIDVAGIYLVVIGTNAYYFAEINSKTGVPGSFTKVTTGFVASKSPRDLYVLSPREVFFCGLGGYVYKATDITAGVSVVNAGVATAQNLSRINGDGNEVIVASGATGAIIKSENRGLSFSTTTLSPEASTLQALEVLDENIYWVGCSTGRVYYTTNGGETWTPKTLPGASGGAVYDIVFPTRSVGYISWSDATPTARLYTTFDGGEDWGYSATRINNWPVFDRGNRIACPATEDAGWACNSVVVAGLAGDGTDGIVIVGNVSKT